MELEQERSIKYKDEKRHRPLWNNLVIDKRTFQTSISVGRRKELEKSISRERARG